MKGSDTADTINAKQRKRSKLVAATSGEDRKKVMMSRTKNFFKHSHASQNRRVGLYPYETMTKLYLGSLENRWTNAPRKRGKPTPQIASDAAATIRATRASSESQSRCGAKLNVLLPSASVLHANTPNADWMIEGYTSCPKQSTRSTGQSDTHRGTL